jgi:hypothetical protein
MCPLSKSRGVLEYIRILCCKESEIEKGEVGKDVYAWLKMRVMVLLKGLDVHRGKVPAEMETARMMFECETKVLKNILAEIEGM